MNIDQYSDLIGLDPEILKDCGVYFIDEHTSVIYSVIENNIDELSALFKQENSTNEDMIDKLNIHGQILAKKNKKKIYQNFIVIMDIFDSFVEKQ